MTNVGKRVIQVRKKQIDFWYRALTSTVNYADIAKTLGVPLIKLNRITEHLSIVGYRRNKSLRLVPSEHKVQAMEAALLALVEADPSSEKLRSAHLALGVAWAQALLKNDLPIQPDGSWDDDPL